MGTEFRLIFLSIALVLTGFSAIVLGNSEPKRIDYLPPPGLQLEPSYCQSVGDDNCDGIVMSYESGGSCIPPNGGPMNCIIEIKEVK